MTPTGPARSTGSSEPAIDAPAEGVSVWRSRGLSLIGLLLAAAMLAALVSTWDRSQDLRVIPSVGALGLAVALVLGALASATAAWVTLFDARHDRLLLVDGLMLSQLGKYVPGGIWQPAGQVLLARRAGVPTGQASAALPAYLLGAAVAAAVTGSSVGWLAPDLLDGWGRVIAAGGLAALLMNRAGLGAVLRLGRRLSRRVPQVEDLPTQPMLLRGALFHVAGLLLQGAAFATLMASTVPGTEVALAMGAFSLAWLAGFLAVPIPAGVGLREAILVAVLGGTAVAGPVVAAGVLHRLLNICVEGAGILTVRLLVHRRGPSTGEPVKA